MCFLHPRAEFTGVLPCREGGYSQRGLLWAFPFDSWAIPWTSQTSPRRAEAPVPTLISSFPPSAQPPRSLRPRIPTGGIPTSPLSRLQQVKVDGPSSSISAASGEIIYCGNRISLTAACSVFIVATVNSGRPLSATLISELA